MLEIEDCDDVKPEVIKNEWSDDAENVDENIANCSKISPKIEEISRIKCEEIHIKEELDIEAEVRPDRFASSSRNIRKSDWEGKKHFCPKCPYSSNRKYAIKKHMRFHSDSKQHKCFLCTYVADNRLSLRAHMSSHKGPTNKFGCHKCHYETDRTPNLKRHFLRHEDILEMFKCPLCPYTSKYKSLLVVHQELHHNKKVRMHKCKYCSFTTKYRVSMIRHQLVHADPTVVNKFECEKCPYWSKRQCDLKKHMKIHSKRPPCKYKSLLVVHQELHHNKKVRMHTCKYCSFTTKYRDSIIRHQLVHADPTVVNKFECEKCPYWSKRQYDLKKHMKTHSKQLPCNDLQMYKCKLCSYQGKTTKAIKAHMTKTHPDPLNVPQKLTGSIATRISGRSSVNSTLTQQRRRSKCRVTRDII